MCCKKWVGGLVTLAVVAVALLVFSATGAGKWTWDFLGVQWDNLWTGVKKQVTPEDRLAMMKKQVQGLDKEIDNLTDKIAHQKIEIQKTEAVLKTNQQEAKVWALTVKRVQENLASKEKAENAAVVASDNSKELEAARKELAKVRKELADAGNHFNRADAILQSAEAQINSQKDTLAILETSREEMKAFKIKCETKIAEFTKELQELRAQETRGEAGAVSDGWKSESARMTESLDDFGATLEVMKEKAKNHPVAKAAGESDTTKDVRNELAIEDLKKKQARIDELAKDNK